MVQIEDSINIPNLEIMECNTSPDVHGHARTCPRTFDGVCLLSHIGDVPNHSKASDGLSLDFPSIFLFVFN